jgi:hypothetical protein
LVQKLRQKLSDWERDVESEAKAFVPTKQ